MRVQFASGYFRRLEGGAANLDTVFEQCCRTTEVDTQRGYGYLLRGMIHDLRGERAEAVADYRSAILLDNYTSAVREARGYLRRPYTLSVQ